MYQYLRKAKMANNKKIIWMVIAVIIALPVYYLLLINFSTFDSKSLKDMQYWFFSTIAQFNGAIVGLMLAALGISYIMHSEKTIFLFKKDEFELLRVTLYLFILNALFAFLCLSVLHHENYIVILTPLTLIIESVALILLGLFFNKSINIFGSEVQQKLRKIENEKIIGNLNIEHVLDNDTPANKNAELIGVSVDRPTYMKIIAKTTPTTTSAINPSLINPQLPIYFHNSTSTPPNIAAMRSPQPMPETRSDASKVLAH